MNGRRLIPASKTSDPKRTTLAQRPSVRDPVSSLVSDARTEQAAAPDEDVASPLRSAFGFNFANVRVHSGPASERAAQSMNAQAFAFGSDLCLGSEAPLSAPTRRRLLTHEAVHTVQQGGAPVVVQAAPLVGDPQSLAERQAEETAHATASGLAAFALRNVLQTSPLRRVPGPVIHRDIKRTYTHLNGQYDLDRTTVSHPGRKSGLGGNQFYPERDVPRFETNKISSSHPHGGSSHRQGLRLDGRRLEH